MSQRLPGLHFIQDESPANLTKLAVGSTFIQIITWEGSHETQECW